MNDVRCICGLPLSWSVEFGYRHDLLLAAGHWGTVDRNTLPHGHDFDAVVRYDPEYMHPAGNGHPCWDCGRPIPAGARCWRRLDARQDMPTICDPCHETVQSALYRQVRAACAGCGDQLRWLNGAWVHESDHVIIRFRNETCPHCGGSKCRLCLRTGKVQVEDHRASPRPEGIAI